jgi:hypothetical protein
VIHSSIVTASPMTIGSRDAIDSIIDAGVASVDAIETPMSADAAYIGSSSGRANTCATRSRSPSSSSSPSISSFTQPPRAARISRASGTSR